MILDYGNSKMSYCLVSQRMACQVSLSRTQPLKGVRTMQRVSDFDSFPLPGQPRKPCYLSEFSQPFRCPMKGLRELRKGRATAQNQTLFSLQHRSAHVYLKSL